MNNSTIAWKTRAQLDDFMVKMFHGFSKPLNKFVRYGNWETKAVVKKKDDRQPTLPGWDELSYLGVG